MVNSTYIYFYLHRHKSFIQSLPNLIAYIHVKCCNFTVLTQEGATAVSFKLVFYFIISICYHQVSCNIDIAIDIELDLKLKMLI